jgi:hypothetical protein
MLLERKVPIRFMCHPNFFMSRTKNSAAYLTSLLTLRSFIVNSTMNHFLALARLVIFHNKIQHPLLSLSSCWGNAALLAASNTSSTPWPVKEEHSRYFLAPMVCAISDAALLLTKSPDLFCSSSMAAGSSRRSFLSPTRIIVASGHRVVTSSAH